jgi:hypothetical protein
MNISISSMLSSHRMIYNTMLFGVQGNFWLSFVFKDSVSLETSCQIFVCGLARLGESISHSIHSDIHVHFIYLAYFIVVIGLHFVMNGHSQLAIEFDR